MLLKNEKIKGKDTLNLSKATTKSVLFGIKPSVRYSVSDQSQVKIACVIQYPIDERQKQRVRFSVENLSKAIKKHALFRAVLSKASEKTALFRQEPIKKVGTKCALFSNEPIKRQDKVRVHSSVSSQSKAKKKWMSAIQNQNYISVINIYKSKTKSALLAPNLYKSKNKFVLFSIESIQVKNKVCASSVSKLYKSKTKSALLSIEAI